MKFLFAVFLLVSSFICLAFSGVLSVWYFEAETLSTPKTMIFTLEKDMHPQQVIKELFPGEFRPEFIRLWLHQNAETSKIRAGVYELPAGTTLRSAFAMFIAGKVKTFSVIFVEGTKFTDLIQVLNNNKDLKHTIKEGTSAEEIASTLGIKQKNPEGLFMPDTYIFNYGDEDINILKRSHQDMQTFLKSEYAKRDAELPYKSSYEALIMASIIERESAVSDERPKIAAVFVNRLKKGMKLQTDPTVIYGVGDRYKGQVLKSFLKDNNPYNTYVINGLPQTPIAMPGRESIKAALHPDKNDYIFFVASGEDSRNTHVFSKTDAEHQRAVQEYRAKVKAYRLAHPDNGKSVESSESEDDDNTQTKSSENTDTTK